MEGMNLQPHLGRFEPNYKPTSNMGGYLALAKVTEVHHKNGTVDVMIVKTNDAIVSEAENEGRFAARVGSSAAHFDKVLMSTSGVVEPIQKGQLVLLAFLDGLKNQPIILCSFHDTLDTKNNILTNIYPLDPNNSIKELTEANKYLRVFPSQAYVRVDGVGGVEVSHPSKTFFKVDGTQKVNDSPDGFDHKDLEEKDPATFETRSGRIEEASMPVSLLFTHRSCFEDDVTTWTKFFLDAFGMFRITRDPRDGTTSFVQVDEDGSIITRRQLDSREHDQGQDYAETVLGKDGTYSILKSKQGKEVKITVSGDKLILSYDGTSIDLTDNVVISAKGDIKLQANTVVQGNLSVQGNLNVSGSASVQGTITMGGKTVATVDQIK